MLGVIARGDALPDLVHDAGGEDGERRPEDRAAEDVAGIMYGEKEAGEAHQHRGDDRGDAPFPMPQKEAERALEGGGGMSGGEGKIRRLPDPRV